MLVVSSLLSSEDTIQIRKSPYLIWTILQYDKISYTKYYILQLRRDTNIPAMQNILAEKRKKYAR